MAKANKKVFINFVEYLAEEAGVDIDGFVDDEEFGAGVAYFESLKNAKDENGLTDKAKQILAFLKENAGTAYSAKDIGEGIGVNPKSVSGATRKLVTMELVEKVGSAPVNYKVSEAGKTFVID